MGYKLFLSMLLVKLTTSGQIAYDSIRLPTPTGPFSVGVVTFHWSDSTRLENATPDPNDFRQFAATVFYPGIRNDEPPRAYFPNLDLFLASFGATDVPAPRGMDSWSRHFSKVVTSVYENIPIDSSAGPYPVLFISPGGDMSRHWYTMMAQDFTSHGYIVVAVSHAHSGIDVFPLGGVVRKNSYYKEDVPKLDAMISQLMAKDIFFITDRLLELNSPDSGHFLKNTMDSDRIAIVGHSRGARAVNLVLESDGRFAGGVRMDETGPVITLSRPHMTLRTPWKKQEKLKELRKLHVNSRTTSYEVIMEDLNHFSFSDLTYVAPGRFDAEINPIKGHFQITGIVLDFLAALFEPDDRPALEDSLGKPKNIDVTIYR